MSDVFTRKKRSEVMSRIRSRGNRDTELALAAVLRRHGITGWRRHVPVRIAKRGARIVRRVAGHPAPVDKEAKGREVRARRSAHRGFSVRPDFTFRKARLAVFVDGCFWHGCPRHATWPANRADWWRCKIEGNQARDRRVNRTLRSAGWRVLRIWEHTLRPVARDARSEAKLVRRIRRALDGRQ